MIVNINGATVTIKGNPTLERNIKEEFDTGKLVIESTRQARYEMYDKVDITTPYGDSEQYLIQADNPVQLNATTYQHNLTLFENIAFFNTVYPADRSFKKAGYTNASGVFVPEQQTLEDILTAYQRELETYHNIDITWSTIPQVVLDETIPFKEFAGLNFSSILLSLFRKIWAVPKVNRVGATWDIYPLYHNARNNSIASESISKMSQQNNVDYATKVKSQLKNAVNERLVGEVTWFPSASGYVLPRSSSLEKITSKLRYELDSNIINILSATVFGITLTTQNINTSATTTHTNISVDLTTQIVQDEIWDLLKTTTSTTEAVIAETDNAKNYIRYKVGQPYITNLYESDSDSIIFKANTEYLINAIWRAFYKENSIDPSIERANTIFPSDTEDIKMQIKYVRQRNIDLVHNRKTKGAMNDTTTIHSQRDSSVELNEYKKNLKIYSNRMGNNEFSKTKVFKYPAEPYELFDYTDEKTIVTRVQNTYHNKFVYCEYEESVDFSNIEAEYALMRRADPYTINPKAVTTNLVVQEYIEFSKTQRALNTRFTSNAQRLLTGLFEATTLPYDKVAVGVFKPLLTSWNTDYAIHMPIESSGDGNLITVHVQFPHQTIAGKTYYDLDSSSYTNTDPNDTYLNPLPYTDSDGRLEDFKLYFTPDILFEDSGEYPLILDETLYLADKYTLSTVTEPLDLDSAASFAETLQVSFIADESIYIGNSIASKNYFVKDQATTTTPVIYSSPKPYGQYDQTPRTTAINGFNDTVITATYNYSYTNRTITITPSVAVDYFSIVKDGDILLAVNQSLAAGETITIYINYSNDSIVVIESSTSVTSNATISTSYTLKINLTSNTSLISTASISTSYKIALNYPVNSNVSAVATIGTSYRTSLNTTVGSSLSAIATISGSYSTILNLSSNSNIRSVASISTSYTTVVNNAVNSNISAIATISGTYTTLNYEWVETTAQTPTINECNSVDDIGNIKKETTQACVYNEVASYQSSTDETTTIPACSVGATYSLCFYVPGLQAWVCTDYEGELVDVDTYYECQLN